MTRLWADTDYGKVRATWHSPDGRDIEFYFESPPKNEVGEHHELTFDGYVGDPVQLEKGRQEAVARMTLPDRLARWAGNMRFLFVHNALWPPSIHGSSGWRGDWFDASKDVLLAVICPLALLGIVSTFRRPTVALVVCTAHVLTMLVVAAFFFAENRYRMPYDVFLFVLALEGARWLAPTIARELAPPVS
jgi:hypothetical protein